MAMQAVHHCPICLDSWDDAAYAMPCLHRFCYACILRWVETNTRCPLCRGRLTSILHSVQSDDSFEEQLIPPPLEPSVVVHPTQAAPGQPAAHHHPVASQPSAAGPLPSVPGGSLQPSTWAVLFRQHPALLRPLVPWLRRELRRIYEGDRREAAAARRIILSWLCVFGPDEEALTLMLQAVLHRDMGSFVRQMINTTLACCRQEVQQQMGLRNTPATQELEGSPAAAPSAAAAQAGSPAPTAAPAISPDTSEAEELPSTSSAALQGGPVSLLSAPIPANGEREAPREEPEEAVAGPSTPSQSTERSPGGPRGARKRKASGSKATSTPNKRPSQQQQ